MNTLAVLVMTLAGVGGCYYYFSYYKPSAASGKLRARTQKKIAEKKQAKQSLDIANVKPGAIVGLSQIGPNLEDFDVTITGRHLIKDGTERSCYLEGDTGERKISISVDKNDGLKIFVILKSLKMRHLGIGTEDLDKFSKNQKGSVTYEEKIFNFDEEADGIYCANENELEPEPYRAMEFTTENEQEWISIEHFDGSLEVSYSIAVAPHQVTVYSIDGKSS